MIFVFEEGREDQMHEWAGMMNGAAGMMGGAAGMMGDTTNPTPRLQQQMSSTTSSFGMAGGGLGAMGAMVLVQAALGIATIVSGVDITLAVLHQGGALVLLTFTLLAVHALRRC